MEGPLSNTTYHRGYTHSPSTIRVLSDPSYFRETNKVADWIANVGHLVSFNITPYTNSALHSILVNDFLGVPFIRTVS